MTERNKVVLVIDYDSVEESEGLKGVKFLKKEDKLIIFYSKYRMKIKAEFMHAIEKTGCEIVIFSLYGLEKRTRDGFIIASAGEHFGKATSQGIAIISNDKGFAPLINYVEVFKADQRVKVVLSPTIEQALGELEMYTERGARVRRETEDLNLEDEYRKLMKKRGVAVDIDEADFGVDDGLPEEETLDDYEFVN